ncbi:hypothetical protein [Treponema socranskii]|uniref:hypothetical protein n=1 Tax=Treponema socranskii TaxID=53419 RepID=UPI003D6E519A
MKKSVHSKLFIGVIAIGIVDIILFIFFSMGCSLDSYMLIPFVFIPGGIIAFVFNNMINKVSYTAYNNYDKYFYVLLFVVIIILIVLIVVCARR